MFKFNTVGKTLFNVLETIAFKTPNAGFNIDGKSVNITIGERELLSINDSGSITIPVDIESRFARRLTKLPDDIVDLEYLKKAVDDLLKENADLILNHVGFCYFSPRRADEVISLVNEVNKSGWHLYEEEANEVTLWLYIGILLEVNSPLLEIMPLPDVSRHDQWLDYYLPHIQIDIDTGLDSDTLEKILGTSFSPVRKPIRLTVIDGVTYSWRVRLGAISGVNIDIDLGTDKRNREYRNKFLLKKIV